MAERASTLERTQVAVETTAGTAVGASKRLPNTQIIPRPQVATRAIKGVGLKVPFAHSVGREHTEARFEGPATYAELPYLLATHLCTPTFSTNTATFAPSAGTANSIKTISVECGQADRAEKFDYGVTRSFQLRATKDEVVNSGEIFGRELNEGATLTAATFLDELVLGEADWKVEIGTDMTGATVTELTRVDVYEFMSRNMWQPRFYANGGSEDSFTCHIEGTPELSIQLDAQQDSNLSAYMAGLRAGTKYFLRFTCTSAAEVALGVNAEVVIECPVRIMQSDRQENDGVWNGPLTLQPVYDADFNTTGGFLKITVTSDVTAL